MSSELALDSVTVDGEHVDRVYEPEAAREAAELLGRFGRDGQHVLLCGGRTRLSLGNVGGPFDAALSTRQLNRIIHYEPDDMTLAVEPGCTIAQLKKLLGEHNQSLALDAAHEDSATIGGALATGLSGPRRLGSGSLKDWLIGIEVAGPDGAISKAGGMVVKNVTGFDMMHMHYGALGAFGLITRINLKAFPAAASSRTVCMRFDTSSAAHSAGIALLTSQLQPSSVVVSNEDGWALWVRCDAPSSAIQRLCQRIVQAASSAVAPTSVELDEDGDNALDTFRWVVDLRDNPAVARLPIPASQQLAALSVLESRTNQRICADIGSGVMYVAGPAARDWRDMIRGVSPGATFLSLPVELKHEVDSLGPISEPAADVVRRLKQSFDPNGVLNRGRFVLGL